jgi:hypothetical protein
LAINPAIFIVTVPELALGETQSKVHEVELLLVCVTLVPLIETAVPAFVKEPLSALTEKPPLEPALRLNVIE